ncbi:hypothetical protein BJX63DRAFT_418846 [Aspergillus granulosus]|uniref:Peptidase S12 Pab87-related C-terminal domain-containing protein n=1 Tax=Aspergillus granulosus TaxID=176169 RepID=A0ABR4HXQ7_9EURO
MDGPTPDNYAKAYMPMDDGSFVSIDRPVTRDGTIQASAGGIRSCVKDLLSFYNAILTSRNLEQSALSSTSETKKATIKNASLLTAGHTFLTNSSLHERSAALGLLRVQLPNTFGDIGPNFGLINPMPTIGRGDPSRLVLWHQESELEAGRAVNPDVKSAQAYTGDYFNTLGNWYIRVFVNEADSGLYMCIQGEDWDIYPLHPYATDTFTWYTTREDQARRGRWPIQAGDYFKFTFVPNAEGEVTQLQWNMDGSVPAGTFYKKASSSDLSGGIEQKPLAAA